MNFTCIRAVSMVTCPVGRKSKGHLEGGHGGVGGRSCVARAVVSIGYYERRGDSMGLNAPWCDRLEPLQCFMMQCIHASPTGRQSLGLIFQRAVSEWWV